VNVRAVREELAQALGNIAGLRVTDVIPDQSQPNYPLAIVNVPDTVQYHQVMGKAHLTRAEISITVLLGRISESRAQKAIDAYCSIGTPESVIDALEDNLPLSDGAIKTLQVQDAVTFRSTDNHVAIDFNVEVYG